MMNKEEIKVGTILKSYINGLEFEIIDKREEKGFLDRVDVVMLLKELKSKKIYFVPFAQLVRSKFEVITK